jgi:hypothetical protein
VVLSILQYTGLNPWRALHLSRRQFSSWIGEQRFFVNLIVNYYTSIQWWGRLLTSFVLG